MLPCNMLYNVRLSCNLLNNWSNTQSQNKFEILAHGCLPPVKICKHRNLFLISDNDRIYAIIKKTKQFSLPQDINVRMIQCNRLNTCICWANKLHLFAIYFFQIQDISIEWLASYISNIYDWSIKIRNGVFNLPCLWRGIWDVFNV